MPIRMCFNCGFSPGARGHATLQTNVNVDRSFCLAGRSSQLSSSSFRSGKHRRAPSADFASVSSRTSAWNGCAVEEKRRSQTPRRSRGARWQCLDRGFLGGLEETLELLLATAAVVPIFKRLNLSPVLGFLFAGVVLGPHSLKLVRNVEDISQIADIGILFLLFEMGLELSIDRLRKLKKFAFGLGTLQLGLSSVVLSTGAWLMGAGISESMVIGSSLSLSSSAFVLQLLAERKEKTTRWATATFGVLLLQDIAVVPLLVLVPLLASTNWSGIEDVEALLSAVGLTAVKAMSAVACVVVGGGAILRPIFRFVADSNSSEAFTAIVLATVLGTGFLTDELGLSMTLGAFIAGVLLSETSFMSKIMVDIEPFRGLLLGLFFITTGMSIDVSQFMRQPVEMFVLVAALIGVKTSITALSSLLFSLAPAEGARVGLILSQGGEFGFVIFGLAMKMGFLSESTNQTLSAVIVSTMALTPLLAESGARLTPWINSITKVTPFTAPEKSTKALQPTAAERRNCVAILGYGPVGRVVADMLAQKFLPYVALDADEELVKRAKDRGVPVLLADGNKSHFLVNVGISQPSAVVITIDSAKAAVKAITNIREDFPDVPIYTRARDLNNMRLLTNLGVVATYPEEFETSLQLGTEVLRGYGVSKQDTAALSLTLRNERGYSDLRDDVDSNRDATNVKAVKTSRNNQHSPESDGDADDSAAENSAPAREEEEEEEDTRPLRVRHQHKKASGASDHITVPSGDESLPDGVHIISPGWEGHATSSDYSTPSRSERGGEQRDETPAATEADR